MMVGGTAPAVSAVARGYAADSIVRAAP